VFVSALTYNEDIIDGSIDFHVLLKMLR